MLKSTKIISKALALFKEGVTVGEVSIGISCMTVVSSGELGDSYIVPIGTSSKPAGLSSTKAELVIFTNTLETRTWYATTKDVKDYLSRKKDKLSFFLDKEEFSTICVKLNVADLASFSESVKRT